MDKTGKVILVTGATGQQGGASARSLLKDGWKIRALVRDENKPASQEIKKLGAELVVGDMFDAASVEKALTGVYGVFNVQNFWEHGYEGELKQAKIVIEAAKKADVKHFVLSSVGGADRNTKIPHFDVKFDAEQYMKSQGLPYTILRPVFFMENFNTWFKPIESDGKTVLNMALRKDTKLQIIATDDIGAIVAIVFDDPDKYIGKEIEIAGDELTLKQMAEAFSKSLGKEVGYNEVPVEAVRENSSEMADMFQWFIDKGYEADINSIKKIYPGLTTFEEWLKKNK
ncbi:MAG: NmrA/HSCARG family protein [Ignavibacteria bacterium]